MKQSEEKLLHNFDVEINVKDVVSIRSTCDAIIKAFSDSPLSPTQSLARHNSSVLLCKINFVYSLTTEHGETFVIGDDICQNGEPVNTAEALEKIEVTLTSLALVFACFKWAERKRNSIARLKAIEQALRVGARA